MTAAVSVENPLSHKKAIPISTFASSPYIQTHPDADSDSARIFSKYNIHPNTLYKTEDSLATFAMVSANLGITMNNRLNTSLWHGRDIVILPLRPRQQIEIGIAVTEEADPAIYYFIDTFQSLSQEAFQSS